MAKIGIYGSSFDPITNVHLWTANTIANRCKLDKVVFLPCSNKRRDKTIKTSNEDRWNLLSLATKNNDTFVLSDYEINQEGWHLTTYETLSHFKKIYPDDEIYFIMGADLLVDIAEGRWGKSEKLIKENKFIVMARDGIDMLKAISSSPLLRNNDDGTFHLLDKGIAMEISSSYIRDELSMGGAPRYLLPDDCYDYILANSLYILKEK
ncbi:nicotinate (nicotinamide) nucleotide adenylyltransferase [Pseudalkalibacillus hwajinpoensis]|uniref:nicotinate (nicotinamide) nucleotide adenylyltransferase n=1 Tax=Guptibacillus hwajinpoensis TaxID=208199 RepID=UPI001CD7990F|nr:nicotinate (nicotinamide) nucleotide adenylyltransferase [Pseudalkalibacillus hwajinpoensis]MCA0993351.1 nicotinate (nicotinamide) nucleotide adenylyltransferase [Pseudalkalibacillus hwajinpoensis]